MLHYNKEEMTRLLDYLETQSIFLDNIGCSKCNECENVFYIFGTKENCDYCPSCGSANIDIVTAD